MKVLIVCSGNVDNLSLEKHHAFVFDQINAIKNKYPDIDFDYFFIKGKGILGYLKNVKKFKQKIRNEKFDLIHAHYALSSLLANLQNKVPVITTFHGSDINFWHLNIISSIVNIFSRQSIFVSKKLKDKIIFRRNKDKMHIIPCGIDLSIFYPIEKQSARNYFDLSSSKKYILFASSFSTKVKNYSLAHKSIKLLNDSSVELLELKNYSRLEVNLLINAVDVVLMTSFSEGSPQFIKEAMAVNCPIVCTDVGDVRELINDTKGCYLTSYNPDEVADKLRIAIKFGAKTEGRAKILHLDNVKIADAVYEIYCKTIRNSFKRIHNKRCTIGLWDESVPGIQFDEQGISNYARIQQNMMADFPLGEKGKSELAKIFDTIKSKGKGKKYDCIIGVSGGTDSSYLLHLSKSEGLKPLAVNLDNGWSSDIAVKNIKKVTSELDIDLETYVIDYEEIKDILKAYMRAGLPWIDNPTDQAIFSVLYLIASREKIKYILLGTDIRSEGKQPSEWTYGDSRQLKYIVKNFGKTQLRTYPVVSFSKMIFFNYIMGMRVVQPFNYIDYEKKKAQQFLEATYGWEYYGEHHHENLFTKWAIGYWMYKKYNIDKRIITYSAQILSGQLEREEALQKIKVPPIKPEIAEKETKYVLKKLGLSENEFTIIWSNSNKTIFDYPSSYKTIIKFSKILLPIIKYVFKIKPKFFYELEGR